MLNHSNLADLRDHFGGGIVSLSDFTLKENIGQGGYGQVCRALHNPTGKTVAIKMLYMDDGLSDELIADFCREVKMLWQCHFPFVLYFHGFTVVPPLAIVMPYVTNGSLYEYTRSTGARSRLDDTQKTLIAIGVAYGMSFLHAANVIHRDLKSMNILLDSRLLPFICDFGVARVVAGKHSAMTRDCGTTYWAAPELIRSTHYDNKIDVYSYGMVLYEMLCDRMPFQGFDLAECEREVVAGKRPELPAVGNTKLCDLIRKCWAQEPTKRPEFTEIYRKLMKGKGIWDETNPKALVAMKRLIEGASRKA
jgi:serine/threonine protein kinase